MQLYQSCVLGLGFSLTMFLYFISFSPIVLSSSYDTILFRTKNSGIWGIFWYKEINQPHAIRMWFLSAFCTIAGIIWLSHERLAAAAAIAAAAESSEGVDTGMTEETLHRILSKTIL